MATAAPPLAREHPDLEPEEPVDSPRDDGVGNELLGRPFVGSGIVEAQGRKVGRVTEPIDVWGELTGPPGVAADQGGDDKDLDIAVREDPAVELSAVDVADADPVGLHDRTERSLPDADPACPGKGLEAGIELPQTTVLGLHREGQQRHHSPKKVLLGVDRAALGAAIAAPRAGMRPTPGTWRLRPSRRSASCWP